MFVIKCANAWLSCSVNQEEMSNSLGLQRGLFWLHKLSLALSIMSS